MMVQKSIKVVDACSQTMQLARTVHTMNIPGAINALVLVAINYILYINYYII